MKNINISLNTRKTMWQKTAMCLLSLLVLFSIATSLAAPVFAADTQSEKVRVGCFPLNGFYNFKGDTVVDGYGVDYTASVFDYAGLPYEYVVYPSWVEALDALSKNEIDMLAPSQHTLERDEIYTFDSFPIGTEYGALLTLNTNDELVFDDFDAFNMLTVGVVPSLVFLDDFKAYEQQNNFNVNLTYYKDTAALIAAMNAGDVDAALVNMMVKTDAMKLLARFGAAPIYYMFSAESGNISEKINLAIDRMTSENPNLQNALSAEYFGAFNNLPYTKEELDFIANCGTLNIACEHNSPPYSYIDDKTGEFTGVNCDIIEKISDETGLKFEIKDITTAPNQAAFVKENNIAVISGVLADNKAKLNGADYTREYLNVYKYFVGESDKTFDLEADAKVACLNVSQAQLDSWQAAYHNFEFIKYGSVDECVKALKAGEVDYHLNNRYAAENIVAAPRNTNLKVYLYEAIPSHICFEVTLDGKDGDILTSILNKAINKITDVDKESLISEYAEKTAYKYTISDLAYIYRFQIVIIGILLVAAIIALILIANARIRVRQAKEADEIKLRRITNNINGGVVVLKANKGLNITYANNGFLNMIGCDREQLEQNGSYLAYVHKDDLSKIQEAIDSKQQQLSLNLRVLKSDGTYVPTLFNCTSGELKDGSKELYCVILDLTEQEKLTEQLQIDKRRTELILSCVDEVFYEVNLKNNAITTSGSFAEKFGWTLPDKLPEKRADYISKTWQTDAESIDKILVSTREMLEKKEVVSVIVKLKSHREKRLVWCEIVQHPVIAKDGSIASVIGLIRDVDSEVSEREKLIERAQHDPLTGLYNKESFENQVTESLAELPDKHHAMIFIDLDHFKNLNDTLGHMKGDKAICEAADKLRIIFSNYDILARFGGDEFCIFVKDIPEETIRRKLDWMLEKLHTQYSGAKGTVEITCSCGVAYTTGDTITYKELMKQADKALYKSKEDGRNRYTFFE